MKFRQPVWFVSLLAAIAFTDRQICNYNLRQEALIMLIRNLDHEKVLGLLPDRKLWSYKGDYGKVLLICGSVGFTGAAALSATGALRSGAGLVFLCVPETIYAVEAVKLTEPIVIPISDHQGTIAEGAVETIKRLIADKDAVLVGPGLGRSAGVEQAVIAVLQHFDGPVVLDADGINAIMKHKNIVRGRTRPTILTPHEGEFTRLGGTITADRSNDAACLARDLGAIVLLKGHETVITDGEVCYENHTGNPGMAVGGSGDVLAGMIVSLIGQGLAPLEAAAAAAWLHGAAGDICAKEIGQYGMLPSDMLNVLPRLMK